MKEQFVGRGEVKGYLFNRITGNPRAFVYEVIGYGQKWYEVFLAKVSQHGEVYPGSKSFGIWAWSYFTRDRALLKLSELVVDGDQIVDEADEELNHNEHGAHS